MKTTKKNGNYKCLKCGNEAFNIEWHNFEQKHILECLGCGEHITSLRGAQLKKTNYMAEIFFASARSFGLDV